MDDAAAWIILAIVLSSFTGNATLALLAAGGAVFYVAVVFLGVRRLLAPLAAAAERTGALTPGAYVTILCLLASGAWFTDVIGVHSVFGAFVLGVSIPRGVLSRELRRSTSAIAPTTSNQDPTMSLPPRPTIRHLILRKGTQPAPSARDADSGACGGPATRGTDGRLPWRMHG